MALMIRKLSSALSFKVGLILILSWFYWADSPVFLLFSGLILLILGIIITNRYKEIKLWGIIIALALYPPIAFFILDIIETYDMKPSQIKDLIQDVTFNKNNLDYWRTNELLDNFSNIEEKKEKRKKRIQKDLGSYVPSILERIYRPGTGVMYQSKASIYDDGMDISSRKSSKKSSSFILAAE